MATAAYLYFAPTPPNLLSDSQPKTPDAYGAQRVAVCNPAKLAAMADPVKRASEQNACTAEAERAKADEDRRAQARSTQVNEQAAWQAYYQARSAAFQSAIALLVLGASAAAAWAAFQAAHYARYAAVETRRGAKASERALRHDQRVDEVQVRPYVYIEGERVFPRAVLGRTDLRGMIVAEHAPITFAIKNFGQTPAKRVRLRARTFIGEHWTEGGLVDLDEAAVIHRADLPPGFSREIEGYAVNGLAEPFARVLLAECTVFFEGLIEYEDAGGAKYETHFRRACTGRQIEAGVFIITAEGNEAT